MIVGENLYIGKSLIFSVSVKAALTFRSYSRSDPQQLLVAGHNTDNSCC